MKVLVLGSIGMAGHLITTYFLERGHDVTAFSMKPFAGCKNIVGDARDEKFFREMLTAEEYDAVINCIGILNQAADDNKDAAVYLNSYLPHMAVNALKGHRAKFVQMSTDCVFAGNTGPYAEHSFRDGPTFYDRTKALGEIDDDKNLTFRNSIVGPDCNENGMGLFNWFMKQSGEISGFSAAMWTGVTTLTLAKAMERAVEEDLCGIYNLVNNTSISKCDLLGLFNRYFKNGGVNIKPDDSLKIDKSLRRSRNDFSFEVPSYEEMVSQMKDWVEAHRQLYPHYFNRGVL